MVEAETVTPPPRLGSSRVWMAAEESLRLEKADNELQKFR